jgi:hypothetical protein
MGRGGNRPGTARENVMPRPLDVLFWGIMLAIVFVLVRPGSKAGAAITGMSTALVALIGDTTGWTGGGTDGTGPGG